MSSRNCFAHYYWLKVGCADPSTLNPNMFQERFEGLLRFVQLRSNHAQKSTARLFFAENWGSWVSFRCINIDLKQEFRTHFEAQAEFYRVICEIIFFHKNESCIFRFLRISSNSGVLRADSQRMHPNHRKFVDLAMLNFRLRENYAVS